MSSTKNYVAQEKSLMSDPCDNRLIRFNNCVQCLSCICNVAAIFEPSLQDAADLLDLFAQLVFMSIMGCMTAQIKYELTDTKPKVEYKRKAGGAPQPEIMDR